MKNITTEIFTIKKVQKLIEQRIFALPRLQRDFVWDGNKAAMLLDSIYKKYPIGIILVWKTHVNNFSVFNQNLKALPPYDSKNNKEVYFIIDGQQRLSSIHQIFKGKTILNSNRSEVNFDNLYFLLEKDEIRFKYLKKIDEDTMIKVTDILSHNWKTRFRNYTAQKIREIEKCRYLLLNYKIVILFVEGSNIEDIRVSFIRINTQLTQISRADQAFTYASKFDFKNRVNQVIDGFDVSFQKVSRESIQRPVALIYTHTKPRFDSITIQRIVKKINDAKSEQEKYEKIWKVLCNSYGIALDYLRNQFGVLNKDFMPSENMLSILTSFFYYNKNSQPNLFQKRQLRKWFWDTAINSRYSGRGYLNNITKDFLYFKDITVNKKNKTYKVSDKLNINKIIYSDYSSGSSFIKGFFCLLAKSKPQYLKNGELIPLSKINTKLNKRNNHHIFPKKALKDKQLTEKHYNSFLNICFLVFKENVNVGAKPPYIYLKDFRRKHFFKSMLKSHLIPYQSRGLWNKNIKRGYKIFMKERLDYICDKFNTEAGSKLFEKI